MKSREYLIDNKKLMQEWDFEKNNTIDPQKLAKYSNKEVYWICSKCKYSWKASVATRSSGHGCPACSGRVATRDKNLEKIAPDLVKEWHPTKNRTLKPTDVLPYSERKVWWKCKKCGGEWKESVINVTKGNRCPFCSGHRVLKGYNDLATLNPMLAKEWNYENNNGLLPNMVTCGSNKKVWWKCKNGHEWFETINRRNKDIICPYCSGKHRSVPLKEKQWLRNYNLAKKYFEENGNLNINAKYITKDGIKLGSWIRTQRVSYKNKSLTNERYKLLCDINMVWKVKPGVKKEK